MINKKFHVNLLSAVLLLSVSLINSCQIQPTTLEKTSKVLYSETPELSPVRTLIPTEVPTPDSPHKPFPIHLPCGDYLPKVSGNNEKIAVVCSKTEGGQSIGWNVFVNDIPITGEWVSLFSEDSLLTYAPINKFSPNNRFLAVADVTRNNPPTIWVFETTHWTLHNVLHYEPYWSRTYSWSGDSQSIAVTSSKIGKAKSLWHPSISLMGGDLVYLLGIDGGSSPLLSQQDVFPGRTEIGPLEIDFDFGPIWSSDGKQAVYLASPSEDTNEKQLILLDPASHLQRVIYQGNIGNNLTWSPNGKKLLIYNMVDIQVFDLETQKMKTIVSLEQSATRPSYIDKGIWSTDSQFLLFKVVGEKEKYGNRVEGGGIFAADLEGGDVERLYSEAYDILQMTADGKDIIYQNHQSLDIFPISYAPWATKTR